MSAEKYRRYATECVGLSIFARAERPRWMLLQMAIAWSELARQAERNDKNDIVYETPFPSSQNAVNKPGEIRSPMVSNRNQCRRACM
jgi:hypothetical protein